MADYDFTYTGAEIQAILDTGKKLKDSGYIFLGVATPSTNPGTPTQKVYYEAKQAGTYTNFGGVVLPDGMSLLIWNGSWTSETVMSGDGGVFDISVYKSSGGTLAKYTDLAAALGTDGANIPSSLRKGGMSVKFVQSSDNKYVQWRLMNPSWSINVNNWQGVDDEPTAGSDNLVKSGGVYKYTSGITNFINASFHLEKGITTTKRIYGNFKSGTKIKLSVSNFTITGTGERNVHISYSVDSQTKYAGIVYNEDYTVEGVFEADTDMIYVNLSTVGTVTSASADVTVVYGSALLELSDVTPNSGKKDRLALALVRNDGTVSSPNNKNFSSIQLLSATEEKAGLMSSADKKSVLSLAADNYAFDGILSKNEHYTYTGPFKAGTPIMLSVSNFQRQGTGDCSVAVDISDGQGQYITVRGIEDKEYVLTQDLQKLYLYFVTADTITSCSADVKFAIGQYQINRLKSEIMYESKETLADVNYSTKNNIITRLPLRLDYGNEVKTKRIHGDFKAGTTIIAEVTDYTFVGTGNHNVNVKAHFTDNTDNFIIVFYDNSKQSYTFTKDAEYIDISCAIVGGDNTTSLTATAKVWYGTIVDVFENIDDIVENIDTIESTIGEIKELVNPELKTFIHQEGELSDYFYASTYYAGFNKPFTKRALLKSLTVRYWDVNSAAIGKSRTLIVGTIDQRNWLLPDKEYKVTVKSVTNELIVTFDLNNIEVQPGQVVFLKHEGFNSVRPEVNFGISTASYDEENPVYVTATLNNALRQETWGFQYYNLDIVEFDSVFITEQSLENINQNIDTLQQETKKINFYTDTVTGEPYKIKIVNGQIVAQLLNFHKILVIGHSFVVYDNSPAADWYLPNGQSRAMAPSVYDNEWAAFVAEKYGAQFTKMSGVDFERNYSPSYNFAQQWNVQDEWDAICVYLNENAIYNDTMQASWEAMLNYLKTAAPHAEIFCTASWAAGDKATAIAAACASVPNINYVNLIGLNSNGNLSWNIGDYYIGRGDKYLPMGAPAGHPSDIGHLAIANKFLEKMGQTPFDNKTKNVTLNQSGGGTISTRSIEQVIGAVVSIKCVADSGKYISGMTVVDANGNNVAVTLRVNGSNTNNPNVYYTFIMPNSDVTVTPTWSSTKNYTTYTATISDTSGGNIKNLNAICIEGTRCYIYVTPNSGKVLSSISASAGGSSLTLTADDDRCYYFDMPAANVIITPVWGNA